MAAVDSETIFDLLSSDHRTLLGLTGTGARPFEVSPAICERIVTAAVRHFVAEEQYLLPLVREVVEDGDSVAHREFVEHRLVEDQLRTLEDQEHDPAAAARVLADVADSFKGHVAWEEEELFPLLRSRTTDERARALAGEVLGVEQIGPTRPRHVRVETPTLNKAVSLVEGYVDQVRDFFEHRGVEPTEGA